MTGDVTADRTQTEQVVGAVVVSGAAQFGAKILLFGLNVVAALAIVRYLGPSSYGDYVFVLSFAAIFGLLGEFGLNKMAARDIARDASAAPQLIGTAMAGQLLLAFIAWLGAQLVFTLIEGRSELRAAVAVASLLYFTEAFSLSFGALFQVRLALQYEAFARVVAQTLDTALVLWLIHIQASLLWLIAAPVVTGAAGVLVAVGIVQWRFPSRFRFELRRLGPLFRESLPLGLTSLVVIAYLRLDSVLLGLLRSPAEVGFYGAASRPVEYLILALFIVVNVLFPLLARWYEHDSARFKALFAHGGSLLIALSLPVIVMVLIFASDIVALLYPPDFAPSSSILRVLIWSVLLTIVGAWSGFALLSAGRQRVVLAINVVALVLNVTMNLALIPVFGDMGAAAAAVATSVVATVSTLFAARRDLSVSLDGGRSARLLFANLCLGAVALAALNFQLHWALAALVALASYPVFLLAWRGVSRAEIGTVAASIR